MALVKITFDSASVTAKQDADCNHFLANMQNGIIEGLGSGVSATTSNNNIVFAAGYVQVYGRRVFVEANTKIAIAFDGTAYGYVFIKFDLANNTISLEKKESSGTYPTLIKDNLMSGGLIYEFALCRYTKTSSSLSIDTSQVARIKNADALAQSRDSTLNNQITDRYGPVFQLNYSSQSGKFFTYSSLNSSNAGKGVGHIYIAGWNLVFSSEACIGSGALYQYKVGSTWYNVGISISSNGTIVETASSDHIPKMIYVTR